MAEHANYPHEPGMLYDCPACEPETFQDRQQRFLEALARVRRRGTSAARSALRDARLDIEAHGEVVPNG